MLMVSHNGLGVAEGAYVWLFLLVTVSLGCDEVNSTGNTERPIERVSIEKETQPSLDRNQFIGRLESLDVAIDSHRGSDSVWAHVTKIERNTSGVETMHYSYNDTAQRNDFWPASTIKMYTATAALELLTEYDMTLDAEVEFYHQDENEEWVFDTSMSMRELIRLTYDCSSNETYTLLLRLAGIDWLNGVYFPRYGMNSTALMRGYVPSTQRPHAYRLAEAQRILITDNGQTIERIHSDSGADYAGSAGCTVYNEYGLGNCSSPFDMSEHLRRIVMHDELESTQRYQIRDDLMRWYRGETGQMVLNNILGDDCGGPVYAGVTQVFDNPTFMHKEGLVSSYRGSIHYVKDADSGTEYVAAIMVNSPDADRLSKLTEEIARVVQNTETYVHLGPMRDHVNPVLADVVVRTMAPGTVTLELKPYAMDARSSEGWFDVAYANVDDSASVSALGLTSPCLQQAGTFHARLRFRPLDSVNEDVFSDLHYVIVDEPSECFTETP